MSRRGSRRLIRLLFVISSREQGQFSVATRPRPRSLDPNHCVCQRGTAGVHRMSPEVPLATTFCGDRLCAIQGCRPNYWCHEVDTRVVALLLQIHPERVAQRSADDRHTRTRRDFYWLLPGSVAVPSDLSAQLNCPTRRMARRLRSTLVVTGAPWPACAFSRNPFPFRTGLLSGLNARPSTHNALMHRYF